MHSLPLALALVTGLTLAREVPGAKNQTLGLPPQRPYWVWVAACSSWALARQDRYTCNMEGKVECLEGWEWINPQLGAMCAYLHEPSDWCPVPRCKDGCSPKHGSCSVPDTCVCMHGYEGPNCLEPPVLPGCLNGAPHPDKAMCVCSTGWEGRWCDEPVCSNCSPTQGECMAPGECACKTGWKGEDCEECVMYPGCEHGTCEQPWECTCQQDWSGFYCNETTAAVAPSRRRPLQGGAALEHTPAPIDTETTTGKGVTIDDQ